MAVVGGGFGWRFVLAALALLTSLPRAASTSSRALALPVLGAQLLPLTRPALAQHERADEDDEADDEPSSQAHDGDEDEYDYAAAQPVSESAPEPRRGTPGGAKDRPDTASQSGKDAPRSAGSQKVDGEDGPSKPGAAADGTEKEADDNAEASASTSQPRRPAPWPPETMQDVVLFYHIEAIGVGVLLVCLLTCLYGKVANAGIAREFEKACMEVYEQNFEDAGGRMQMEGFHNYQHFASGRAHVTSCQTRLELAKRQDALNMFVLFPFFPVTDLCRLELPMDCLDLVSFCVCRKREAKGIQQAATDLRDYARVRKVDDLQHSTLCVMADSIEVATHILQQPVVKVLRACEEWVETIHVSNAMNGDESKKGIHFVFRLPPKDKMDVAACLVRLAFHLVDISASFRLTEKVRQQVVELRRESQRTTEADKRLQQEQRMRDKKLEKKKALEESAVNLSHEAQRKLEEKEYKKSLKARMPKTRMSRG